MAGIYDFEADTYVQGDAWSLAFRLLDDAGAARDLTGLTPKMMLRDPLDLAGAPLLTVPSAAWSASPSTTGCRIGDQSDPDLKGWVRVFIASADNAVAAGKWSYDVQLTDANGNVETFIAGKFPVRAQVTT